MIFLFAAEPGTFFCRPVWHILVVPCDLYMQKAKPIGHKHLLGAKRLLRGGTGAIQFLLRGYVGNLSTTLTVLSILCL